jgi:SAM-dependent methyltransferase
VTYDRWSGSAAYESYVGRWSRLVAEQFVPRLGVPPGRRWLDVGCGTGALTGTLLGAADPGQVLGVDTSAAYLALARDRVGDRAGFAVADARRLPLPDATVDAVVSGLAVNFVPEPARAVAEFVRVTRPGGLVAAYVWDYADGMTMMRLCWDALAELDSAAVDLDEARRFPLCRPEPLADAWLRAGLARVEVAAVEVPTVFADFADYWQPFLGGQGALPGYLASRSPHLLVALRETLRSRLPVAPDGTIALTARAWAVHGRRP